MKTLLVLGTHFVDENIISEYRKMKNTPNVDAVLAIDNTKCKFKFKKRVEDKIFFDTNCKCFFFDSKLNDEMQLPQFLEDGTKNFTKTLLNNGDYRFYYIRKFFPDYDYYWLVEYDVFCNAETYEGFLKKFENNNDDLLIQHIIHIENSNDDNSYTYGLDWIYKTEKIYRGLFPVVRLSARAIDFLYKRRLEHVAIFQNSTNIDKHWIYCEIFVASELINSGFTYCDLNEEHIKFLPPIYLNDERIFLKPDNHLYHPVKSVKDEISKYKEKYDDLFLAYRKVFLTQTLKQLVSISDLDFKNFPIQFKEKFESVSIFIPNKDGMADGNLYCEIFFQNDRNGLIKKVTSAVAFQGQYMQYFEVIDQCIKSNNVQSVQILETPTGETKMLAFSTPNFDNISQVAEMTKILLEITYTVVQELKI